MDHDNHYGLYVHIPFCMHGKCTYCDFFSLSDVGTHQVKDIVRNTCIQLKSMIAMTGKPSIKTVFIGGGTPNSIDRSILHELLSCAGEWIEQAEEVSMEINPSLYKKGDALFYKKNGINRISIGVQSLDPGLRSVLGRAGSRYQVEACLAECRSIMENVSIDLMYGIPGQTEHSLKSDAELAAFHDIKHVSYYALTLENGTPLARGVASGLYQMPRDEQLGRFESILGDILGASGLHRYEVSNYAVRGFECKHNIGYWNLDPYMGIGPGAVSTLSVGNKPVRLTTQTNLEAFAAGNFWSQQEELSAMDFMKDFILMNFRKTAGMSEDRFYKIFGVHFDDIIGPVGEKLLDDELLFKSRTRTGLTPAGMDIMNNLLARFFGLADAFDGHLQLNWP